MDGSERCYQGRIRARGSNLAKYMPDGRRNHIRRHFPRKWMLREDSRGMSLWGFQQLMRGGKKRSQRRRQRTKGQRDKKRNLRMQCHESQGQNIRGKSGSLTISNSSLRSKVKTEQSPLNLAKRLLLNLLRQRGCQKALDSRIFQGREGWGNRSSSWLSPMWQE